MDTLSDNIGGAEDICNLTPFSYRDLKDGEFRLFEISQTEPVVEGILRHYKLSEFEGKYNALSYVCGTQGRTVPIICNGKMLLVTRSLYDTIRQALIYTKRRKTRPIWIDAICINQYNPIETAREILRMRYIYPGAKRTLVYIGPSGDGSDLVMDCAASLVERLSQVDANVSGRVSINEAEEESHSVWLAISLLLLRPWFKRLWTLQEAALSKHLTIGCGTKWIKWETLCSLFVVILSKGLHNHLSNAYYAHTALRLEFEYLDNIPDFQLVRRVIKSQGCLSMPDVFFYAQRKQCTEPIDRLWALYGLMPPAVQQEINNLGLIDQTMKGRKEYWDTYKRFARWYVTQDPILYILSTTVSDRTIALPTWCPNWNSRKVYSRILAEIDHYHAGYTSEDSTKPQVSLGDDCDEIKVHGFQVEKVKEVIHVQVVNPGSCKQQSGINGTAAKNLQWESQCLKLSYRTFNVPGRRKEVIEAHWRTLVGDSISYMDKDSIVRARPCSEGERKAYDLWKSLLLARKLDKEFHFNDSNEKARSNQFEQSLFNACNGRKFFSTSRGRIGLGPADIKEGDDICIFFGAKPVFVLRSQDHGIKSKLVGDAYVHGLMKGELINDLKRQPAEAFSLI